MIIRKGNTYRIDGTKSEVKVVGFAEDGVIVQYLTLIDQFQVVKSDKLVSTREIELIADDYYIVGIHLDGSTESMKLPQAPTREDMKGIAERYGANALTVTRKFKVL